MSIDEFREPNDPERSIVLEETASDLNYIRWQVFDEIPEGVYTIECEGYFDKDGKPLTDERSTKHLTDGESLVDIDSELEFYDENGNIDYLDYEDYYYNMSHDKYDLRKMTKQIRTKKFICEAPIGSGKSIAIRKWIFAHKNNMFMVIIPTVNIAEEFYTKLSSNESIRLCVNENAFKEFNKAVHDKVNIIVTAYHTASKCLGNLIEEYYEREQRLDYFLVIDEAHLLLQHIGLIEISKEFDKVALISATSEDIKHFACFKEYIIVNPCISVKYNRNIYINKLMPDATEQRSAIVNLIDVKRMD